MSTEVNGLPDDVTTLQSLVRAQLETIETLKHDYDQLKAYLDRLLRDRFGPRSEKIDPSQLSLFAPEAQPEEAPSEPPPDEPAVIVKQHARRDGRGRKLPEDLPREEVEHDLSDAEKSCPCCGETRERIGSEKSEQLEFEPAKLKVLVHVRYKYACKHCEENVAIAEAPSKPIAKGLPGPGLLSHLIVSKYAEHMPLYRLEDEMARFGLELTRGTMCRWMRHTAELLEPLYDAMTTRVLTSSVIHTDDTPVSVLDPLLPATRTGRFWVYVGDDDNPYSIYEYTPSRKRDGPATFLEDFSGYLQADAYGGYEGIYASKDVKQVSCWAHARRKFFDARKIQPGEAHVALAYIGRLYKVESDAKKLAPADVRTNAEARLEWHKLRFEMRQEHSRPILEEFQSWMKRTTTRDVLPKSVVGQAINYVSSRWDSFIRYCEDGRLAIDNNVSERTLRPCAIGRKNWLFLGDDDAGKTAAILFSLMASAKRNELEPWAYLKDVIEELSVARASPGASQFEVLLPDPWLANHPDSHRRYSR